MENSIPDHLFKRLQKLLKLAENAKKIGSLAEAENAALKAQELMAEYNLSLTDVNLEQEETKLEDVNMDHKDVFPKSEGTWIKDLYHCIAYYNYCRAINFVIGYDQLYPEEYERLSKALSKAKNGSEKWLAIRKEFWEKFFDSKWSIKEVLTIRLVGEPHNVKIVQYIVEQLINRVRPMAKESWKEYNSYSYAVAEDGEFEPKEKKGQYIRGFLSGFVQGVNIKLSVNKKKMETERPQITTMALTLINEVDNYCETAFTSSAKKSRGGGGKSESGRSAGIEKGLTTEINKGVETNALNQSLLN